MQVDPRGVGRDQFAGDLIVASHRQHVGREIRLNDDSGIGRPVEVAAEGMSRSSEAIAKEAERELVFEFQSASALASGRLP